MPPRTGNSPCWKVTPPRCWAAAFNTNATQVVSGGADRQLKVDIATREKDHLPRQSCDGGQRGRLARDGSSIVAATDSCAIFRYTNLKS